MEGRDESQSPEPSATAEAEAAPAAQNAAGAVPGVSRRLRSILESLLFAAGDPLPLARIVQLLPGYERRDVVRALGDLAEEYARDERGFRVQQVAGGYQLRTPRANAEFVKALLAQRPVRLTRAALETLAVVAYRQPVTRPEIEAIRGVDVDAVLSTLLERRLVRVLGRKDVVGRPLLFGTTPEFLEAFGLKDLSALPKLAELGASADALERAARAAAPPGAEPAAVEPLAAEPPAEPLAAEPSAIDPPQAPAAEKE
ncbi:MAG: SMC-Scp complex subunit ScpB [Deltaproteobacteria bacterium]|nr:SMC-Scp complex subunit ScpB [Deltaproteobacteria bacterium]